MTQPGMVAEGLKAQTENAAIRERAFKPEGSQTWHEKGSRLPLVRETASGVQAIGDSVRRKECVALGLDVLQQRGAKSVNLKGSQEFRKEAWLQASERGMAAKGYQPTMEDRKELKTRMAQREQQSQGRSVTNEQKSVSPERQEMLNAARAARNQNAEARQTLENRQQQQLVAGQQR